MSLLEVKNLKVSYGGIQAVKGIDLHIDQGELVTLIGANGAGKTTTLRTLVGMVKPSEATSIVTADILRSAVGRMLVDRSWTPTPCAVDPATSTTAIPAPPGG